MKLKTLARQKRFEQIKSRIGNGVENYSNGFYGDAELRTCKSCASVMESLIVN
jgi:hypothetical protein